ncbi:tetratricopeptide repeat protein [Streptomyces sp. NPDC005760]|uniref:tetratricopeptide repeat protein n=1 Tax=Streptomyces sp. NPDC005760 TaxID=3156718 RepID=UPI00340D38CE
MGLVRILLPLPRAAARLSPEKGGPLLGAALLHCVMPSWVLLWMPSAARRLAWAEQAVAVYGSLPGRTHGLSRAQALRAYALLLNHRAEEACAAADAALALPDTRLSPPLAAFVIHQRAGALAEAGRIEEAVEAARESVELYRARPAPGRRERLFGTLPGALRLYGLVLAAAGRRQESVAAYEECAALLAALSFRQSARVGLVRPRVLAELVSGLRALGRYEDALGVGPEAREAARGAISWSVPAIMLPLRVRLLVDLARCHSAVGDPAEARACAVEAVAEARKPHGADALPQALDCLADVLAQLGQTDKELSTRRELDALRGT